MICCEGSLTGRLTQTRRLRAKSSLNMTRSQRHLDWVKSKFSSLKVRQNQILRTKSKLNMDFASWQALWTKFFSLQARQNQKLRAKSNNNMARGTGAESDNQPLPQYVTRNHAVSRMVRIVK